MTEKKPRVIVIGTGVGGIALGVYLRLKFPDFDNFVFYEKADDLGGTWKANSYPGCSSDIPSMFFSLSTDLNPEWDYTHAHQSQFLGYWKNIATKYNILSHMQFNTLVTSAEWDPSSAKWKIKKRPVKDDISKIRPGAGDMMEEVAEDTEGESEDEAEILISAIGILEVVRYPDIPGLDTFKGPLFHSGAWDHNVDLKGKRIAVVGNGASATQLVPVVSQDPLVKVTNFCRTPNWILPPIREKHSALTKWMFKHVPFMMKYWRYRYYWNSDMFYATVFAHPWLRAITTWYLRRYILSTGPKKYHDKLVPSYTLGCKRVIFDTDYLASLHRPNVDMNWDGIEHIEEDGIVTKKGEKLQYDALAFATGYVADDFPLHVKGVKETVKEYYNRQGGPTAYMGTTLPGFPNFFMLAGPNTTTGHTSVIFTEECQIGYMLQLMEPVLKRQLSTVVVTDEATKRYNDKIQDRLNRSVFVQCVSWYRKGGDGKVTSIFPASASTFWWWFRKVSWDDYRFDSVQWVRNKKREEKMKTLKNVLSVVVTVLAFVYAKRAGYVDLLRDQGQRIAGPVLAELSGRVASLKSKVITS